MKKKKVVTLFVVLILLISVVCVCFIPKVRASLFVYCYHNMIEDALTEGHGVPADEAVFFGYDSVNSWEGDHPMTEFVLAAFGNTYYGCYYSPDDVPLAFQNADVKLSQDGHEYWEWKEDGDNHGSTSKIMKYWYFFKVSF